MNLIQMNRSDQIYKQNDDRPIIVIVVIIEPTISNAP